jgi:hypothetical protein
MPLRDPGMLSSCNILYLSICVIFVFSFHDSIEYSIELRSMHQEILGAFCLVQNFRKLTEIQSFEVFWVYGELSGEGVQVLYLVVLQVLWSTSTFKYWYICTLTMMYSSVLVHLITCSVVLVFYDVQNCCTALSCTPSTLEY